jgi:hypothetical protein
MRVLRAANRVATHTARSTRLTRTTHVVEAAAAKADEAAARALLQRTWQLRLVIAPSREPNSGRGLFVACTKSRPNDYLASDTPVSERCVWVDGLRCRAALCALRHVHYSCVRARRVCRPRCMCPSCEERGAVVFRAGDVIGFYYGIVRDGEHDGSYALVVEVRGITIDAETRGSMMKYCNGRRVESECNAEFRRGDGYDAPTMRGHDSFVLVVARRTFASMTSCCCGTAASLRFPSDCM